MNDVGTILTLSTIMWLLIDWLKPLWASAKAAKYITMAVALVGSAAMVVSFGLDLLTAAKITTAPSIVGAVFAALAMTAGSGLINEIVKAISGTKGNSTDEKV